MDDTPGRFPPPPEHDGTNSPMGTPGAPYGNGQRADFYPLDVNRVMKLTFHMFRFRWPMFVTISLAVMVPLGIGSALLEVATIDSMSRWQRLVLDVGFQDTTDPYLILSQFPLAAIAGTLVGSVAIGLLSSIAVAALAHATATTLAGGRATVAESLAATFAALGRLARLYGVIILISFLVILVGALVAGTLFLASFVGGSLQPGPLVFGGLIAVVALCVVLVFVGLRLTFAVPTVIIEGSGAIDSARRSWTLVRGAMWRILGYLLLFGIVAALPAALIGGIASALIGPGFSRTTLDYDAVRIFANALISQVAAGIFLPIEIIAMTLLYFDVRSRRGEPVPAPGSAKPGGPDLPQGPG